MRVIGLPAIPGFASGNWRLERSQAVAFNPFGKTRDRTEFDGAVWRGALSCPKYNDEDAAVFETWLDQVSKAENSLYISPPQNELRGAWSLPELVSNGTFEGGVTTGWTGTGATLSINARRLKIKNSGAAIGYARQTLTVEADKAYVLLVDLHPGNVEGWRIRLLDGADVEEHVSYYDRPGRVPIVHIPSSTSLKVELGCNTAVAGDDVKFANVRAARCLLVDDSLAVGNELAVKQGPVSTDGALKVGQFVTIRLWNGWQMVRLIEDLDTDANGKGVLKFEPELRDGVLGGGAVVVHAPFMRATLEAPVSEAQLEPANFKGMAVDFLEDPTEIDGEVPHDTDIIWEWDANSLGLAPTIGEGTSSVTSDATDNYYFDSDGVMKAAAANSAVFEFDPVVKFLKGQRIQGQRTNLCWPSSDLADANWVKTDSTITANAETAPNGEEEMDLVTEGTAGTAEVRQSHTGTANANQVFYKFLKRGNHDWVRLSIRETAAPANLVQAWFNLYTGAKGSVSAAGTGSDAQSFMYDVGDGVYLCILMGKVNNAATGLFSQTYSAAADGSGVRVGNATRYEWGGQIENNVPFWSSHIPTLTASVTRDNDLDTLALANIPDFTTIEYTIETEFLLDHVDGTGAATRNVVALDDGTSNEFARIRIDSASTDVDANTVDGGVTQADRDGDVVTAGVPFRCAYGNKANDFAFSTLGAAAATDTSGTMPTPTTLRKGNLINSNLLNGYLRRLRIRKTKKPNRQYMAMSA